MKHVKNLSMLAIVAIALMSFTPPPMLISTKNLYNYKAHFFLVSWDKERVDFGDIAQAKPVSTQFVFTNTGNEPLLVSDVVASCGCTATNYSKAPIMPGKSSSITVTYNAVTIGAFNKNVTVNFNSNGLKKVLYIIGNVQ